MKLAGVVAFSGPYLAYNDHQEASQMVQYTWQIHYARQKPQKPRSSCCLVQDPVTALFATYVLGGGGWHICNEAAVRVGSELCRYELDCVRNEQAVARDNVSCTGYCHELVAALRVQGFPPCLSQGASDRGIDPGGKKTYFSLRIPFVLPCAF